MNYNLKIILINLNPYLKSDGKAVTAKVNELDFPGVTVFEGKDLNLKTKPYANIIMKKCC